MIALTLLLVAGVVVAYVYLDEITALVELIANEVVTWTWFQEMVFDK